MRPNRRLTAVLALTLVTALGTATARAQAPSGADQAAKTIDRNSLAAPIRFLADDLLEGRAPASRGDRLARLYIETTLQALGLEPGGPGGAWQQPFDIVGITSEVPKTWDLKAGGNTVTLKWWDDFIAASGVQSDKSTLDDAELVFVGYGIEAPEYKWDDFKGENLKGKVVVMLNNDPDWDPALFEGNRRLYYGRWTYKYESAAKQGAAGAIIIHTVPSAGYGWNVIQSSWSGEQFELPAAGEPRSQVAAWTTEDAMRRLMKAAGKDLDALVQQAKSRDFKPVPLGITTSFSFSNKISKVKTANVGGLLRGSDPVLKNEVVVYTAHHDHLGVGEPDKAGDKIYNGAVDNASGCGQVLAIARAFTELPERPKRSVLFLFVAAEEQGLLGSEYFAQHPTFPPGRIAANLNTDSGNIFGRTTDLTFVGLGKSSLDAVVKTLAAKQDREVKGDQFPDKGFFYRSDQFNFAKIGVPAIYLESGTDFRGRPKGWGKETMEAWETNQYHQASDNFDDKVWNFDGMIEDARLSFLAGLTIADDPKLPAWNPGDEFEAARKQALAAVAKDDGMEKKGGR